MVENETKLPWESRVRSMTGFPLTLFGFLPHPIKANVFVRLSNMMMACLREIMRAFDAAEMLMSVGERSHPRPMTTLSLLI
jgi:hypothetical protein